MKMLSKLAFFILGLASFNCSWSQTDLLNNHIGLGQEVKIYDTFEEFSKNHLSAPDENGKIKVIHFWATWCKPCVKELPHILDLANSDSNIELLLVSLDMKKDVDKKLKPFLIKNNIKNKVVLLADPDANNWVSKVDQNWEGSIPSSLFLSFHSRIFFEQEFESLEEIKKAVGDLH